MKRSYVLTVAVCILAAAVCMPQSAFALTWTYYDQNNNVLANPTQEEISQLAVTRISNTGITQYALEITHDFSGTWGTGYLENIGNPVPAVGKHWKTKDEKVICEVDGIVPDIYNINSRYVTTAYRAKGSPNAGYSAHAIQFDGVDDYISVNGINLANVSNFTIDFWAKRDQLGRNECLFGQGIAAGGQGIEFGYWDSENHARVHLPGWIWARTGSATDTGWHQWRVEYSVARWPYGTTSGAGLKIRIFRDNQLVSVSSGDIGDVAPVCTGSSGCRTVNWTERKCVPRTETYKEGCNTKTRTVYDCYDVPKSRQECWGDNRCTDRVYTGVGAFYIGKGIGTSYFKGQMKDILIKVNGQIIGNWKFNDGNQSHSAADSSGYNRHAALNNFNYDTCWSVDPKITKIYDFAVIQSKQIIPEFVMTAPSSIIYDWGKQFAVTISVIPESRASKASLKITDTSGQDGQIGTGRFWYKLGTAMKLSSEPDDCLQLIGYRDNLAADPTKEIFSNEIVVSSLDNALGITWVYSPYIYKETVKIGSPVSFSSVPLTILQRMNLAQKPSYQPDASNTTPETELFYWSSSENKLFPVKPNQTFQVQWEMSGECPGTKLITQITTQWPDSPHYIHVAETPPVNLDASAEDLFSFKEIKYTTGDGAVTGKDFTAKQPGKSVLVFTRGDVISNPDPKEVSLTLDGKGYADAGKISLNRQAFTVEFWAKRSVKDLSMAAIGQGTMEADKGLMIGFSGDNSFMFSFFGNDLKTADPYSDTDWHHWACVYEAQIAGDEGECFQCLNDPVNRICRWSENTCYTKNFTGKSVYENGNWTWDSYYYANRCFRTAPVTYKRIIYRDGVKVAEDTTDSPYKGTGSLRIGTSGEGWTTNMGFFGQMDEVRIWETALPQQTLNQNMNSRLRGDETGLIGYWRFDNIGGSFENDSRKLWNDPFGSKTYMAMGGGTSYMEIPDSVSLNLTSELTVEAWVNVDVFGDTKVVGKADTTAGYVLGISSVGGLYPEIWDSAGTRYSFSSGRIEAGQWTHLAVTWKSGGKLTGYINGSKVNEIAAGVNPVGATGFPLRIGAAPWDPSLFKLKGKIDDVRIWNIQRTQTDIKAGAMKQLTGKEPGLVAYYHFDNVQDNRLPDATAFNNKGVIVGATLIQEGMSDNMISRPVNLVNLEPSSAWTVNTDKLYDITPADVATKGIACVRVVETIPAESDKTLTGKATVGTELVSSFHDTDVPHNGYVFREIGPYNADIYDRQSKIGSIYPVNSFHPSKDPKEDRILVVWYRMQDGIAWSYQAVDYTVEWPQSGRRIVVASRLGSEGKDAAGDNQVYPDMNGADQNYADPRRYRDMKIYNQPDKVKPGYNPNEEHALAAPSFRHSQMSPQPSAAFALRNDLNITSGDGFTSQPFVLVQYYDSVDKKHGMEAYKVEIEDPQCGYTFNYDMKAGDPIVAPYPLNTVIGATPPMEIYGKNGDASQKCYWEDHKGQPWVISGAGKSVSLSEAVEVNSREYTLKLASETFKLNKNYLIKVTDANGPVGSFKFIAGNAMGNRDNAPVQVNGNRIADGDSAVTVTLKPGIAGLNLANFQLYQYTSNAHVLTYFWYPLDPTFWIGEATPGNGTGESGKPYPFLPVGVVAAADKFPSNMTGKAKAREVRYDIVWPDNLAVLKAGETLTFPGGEYRADNRESAGLPGVLGWASGQVVFDELNPTMDEAKLFTNYQVRLSQILEERSVDLKIDKFPEDFKPAAKRVDVIMNRYYFKDLHAGLKNRIYYDPMTEKLIMRGFVNNKTVGDKDLTSAPPAVYVVQPNIMTATERDTIKALVGANIYFKAAVDNLYSLTRNPHGIAGVDYGAGIAKTSEVAAKLKDKPALFVQYCDSLAAWFGGEEMCVIHHPFPDIAFGPGLALMPNDALLDPDTSPFKDFTEGFVTLAENNHPDMGSLPVALHIIKVKKDKYRGAIKTVFSDNVFDEKITLRHTADFGGKANDLVFDWRYREEDGTDQPTPDVAPEKWKSFPDFSGKNGAGMTEIALAGAGSALLSDNLFFVRYRHKNSPADNPASWSNWAGAANSRPPKAGEDPMDTYQAQLSEGWIKRVLNGVNPFEARIKNFYSSDNPATYISMIQQAGPRYEGPVAFNPQKDVIENVGLIELYQTVLDRGKDLSINLSQPVCTSGVTAALMLAASRISGFYTLLGNEAYNDALDPTIGYGTSSVEYGSLAPTIFAFTNQVPSLLEEELALMRGRSESGARPVYNRLMWNFTKDRGEAAYAMNYNLTDVNKDGFINADDGQKIYPQGHGDAWGHYLSAVKAYYDLLRHPEFKWESRSEKFQIQGVVMDVDYLDERKFAEAAAAKAKVGKEVTDLTYRQKYVADPDGQWQGYKDTNRTRAWGVSEWARRAFHGAYFDWAEINAILPSAGAYRLNRRDLDRLKDEVPLELYNKLSAFEDQGYATQDAFKAALTAAGANPTPYPNIVKYAEKSGLKQIDRTTVVETLEIASQARSIQKQSDDVNTGLNPLGLANEMVPFDIDPARMADGVTQFEQVYERAEKALENARVIFDYANDLKNRIRQTSVTAEEFAEQVDAQDRDYRNRLIETFGTPYEGVIGSGKVYPAGYQGPDYFLYNYIDVNQVSAKTVPAPSSEFRGFFAPMNKTFRKDDETTGSLSTMFTHYFKTDLTQSDYTSTDFSGVLEIKFPQSASKYSFQAPAEWGMRKSPGEVQQALIELVKAEVDLQLALAAYDGVIGDIEWALKLLEAKSNLQTENLKIKAAWAGTATAMNTVKAGLKLASGITKGVAETVQEVGEAAAESIPKAVGLATDAGAPARGAIKAATIPISSTLKRAGEITGAVAEAVDAAKEIGGLWKDFAIDKLDYKYEIQEQLKELESILGGERSKRLEVFKATENMRQVGEKYLAVLGKGLRLLEERQAFNAKVAAKTQGSRYMDMNFRLSLNDALSKYRSMFDVAARFAFLAAKAYDYETNLSDRDPASPKPLIADIMRQRTIGQFKDGQYIVGQGGLGDSLARLKANFSVLKTQMGLNNPQNETSRMSLRYELFRIKKDASENEAWRRELLKCSTDNLWRIPEFRKYCRPFIAESAGAQPGIIIPFTTNVISGKNFFGWPLGGGDHAYDPTNFATKVRSVGLWFEGYDNSLLAETPRAYLIPAGSDYMLVPNSMELDSREWTIIDQKIPVPLPVGASDLANPNWFPSLDSLNGPMVQIRKYSSARAYHDAGYFDADQMNYDSRLIGRSVWNSRWLLIIPGATFHYDAEFGMDKFINSVTDIKLFFQTYAISGN